MLKKIRVEDLCLGMHIKEFCGSWMEHPFWREDFLLTDHDDLRRVKAEMQARFPRMAVETWFARLEGAEARFDPEP